MITLLAIFASACSKKDNAPEWGAHSSVPNAICESSQNPRRHSSMMAMSG